MPSEPEDKPSSYCVNWGGTSWAETRFARSPRMSTYLLCIVIGRYSCLSKQADSTTISVYAPLNRYYSRSV